MEMQGRCRLHSHALHQKHGVTLRTLNGMRLPETIPSRSMGHSDMSYIKHHLMEPNTQMYELSLLVLKARKESIKFIFLP